MATNNSINTGTPTTVGKNILTLVNPSAVRYLRINADNTVTAVSRNTLASELTSYSPVKQNTSVSLTGSVAETILVSTLIPAGTFEANDHFFIYSMIGGNSSAGSKTYKYYFNTANTLAGATQIATYNFTTNTLGAVFNRYMVFKNALNSQQVQNSTTTIANENNVVNAAITTLAIDFSVDQYFIMSGQLSNGADNLNVYGLTTRIQR